MSKADIARAKQAARGSIVRHKTAGWYGLVRLVGGNGRISVKSIVDDAPSSFYPEDDFVLASEADVPWFKPKTYRPFNETDLLYWELPSGEKICESDSVWFSCDLAFSTRISQVS
jgi:hypothetical protein